MVKTSSASHETPPSPDSAGKDSKSSFEQSMYQRNLFMVMALNMTWQLALVVIIPIVGGFKLDEHFDSNPWFTVLGFLMASAGVLLVLKRVVSEANVKANKGPQS